MPTAAALLLIILLPMVQSVARLWPASAASVSAQARPRAGSERDSAGILRFGVRFRRVTDRLEPFALVVELGADADSLQRRARRLEIARSCDRAHERRRALRGDLDVEEDRQRPERAQVRGHAAVGARPRAGLAACAAPRLQRRLGRDLARGGLELVGDRLRQPPRAQPAPGRGELGETGAELARRQLAVAPGAEDDA